MIVVTGAFGVALLSCAQEGKIPANVQKTFDQKFPTAKAVKWDKENEKEWEAEYQMDGNSCSANFSLDGKWLETETEIKKEELPDKVTMAVSKSFDGYKIEAAETIDTPEGRTYEVEVEKGKEIYEVILNKEGDILKKIPVVEEEGNDVEP